MHFALSSSLVLARSVSRVCSETKPSAVEGESSKMRRERTIQLQRHRTDTGSVTAFGRAQAYDGLKDHCLTIGPGGTRVTGGIEGGRRLCFCG
jgi:hypothetical protein